VESVCSVESVTAGSKPPWETLPIGLGQTVTRRPERSEKRAAGSGFRCNCEPLQRLRASISRLRNSAWRKASATMLSVGFAEVGVLSALPSEMNKFLMS
jgi:hypothetical protein